MRVCAALLSTPTLASCYFSTAANSSVPASPVSDSIVSSTDQVARVVFTSILNSDPTSQNPESLTCDSRSEPKPVASTSSSGRTPMVAAMGARIPEATAMATVAEPMETRTAAASAQASEQRRHVRAHGEGDRGLRRARGAQNSAQAAGCSQNHQRTGDGNECSRQSTSAGPRSCDRRAPAPWSPAWPRRPARPPPWPRPDNRRGAADGWAEFRWR